MINALKLLLSIFVCHLAGIIGGFFTARSIPEWYAFIKKPSFNPPDWIFGPVWITLFTMMGISAFLVWQKGLNSEWARAALFIFLLQLTLNCLWSIVFFGFRSIGGALIVIVLLWLSIVWVIVRFFAISKLAAALLIPYIIWVSFAFLLNVSLLILNL